MEPTTYPTECNFFEWMSVRWDGLPFWDRHGRGAVCLGPEGAKIAMQWSMSLGNEDGLISGVFADWVEDNTGDFYNKELFLKTMRERFNDPDRRG